MAEWHVDRSCAWAYVILDPSRRIVTSGGLATGTDPAHHHTHHAIPIRLHGYMVLRPLLCSLLPSLRVRPSISMQIINHKQRRHYPTLSWLGAPAWFHAAWAIGAFRGHSKCPVSGIEPAGHFDADVYDSVSLHRHCLANADVGDKHPSLPQGIPSVVLEEVIDILLQEWPSFDYATIGLDPVPIANREKTLMNMSHQAVHRT